MKLCKDCKFAKVGLISRLFAPGWRFAKCHHPVIGTKISDINPVNGRLVKSDNWYCDTLRGHSQECGHYGTMWEPKQ